MPRPRQVDFLISACSSVVLTPSMAAMVANRIGVRRDAVTYALGGQGCTAGVIAVDLARRLMQARPAAGVLQLVGEHPLQLVHHCACVWQPLGVHWGRPAR